MVVAEAALDMSLDDVITAGGRRGKGRGRGRGVGKAAGRGAPADVGAGSGASKGKGQGKVRAKGAGKAGSGPTRQKLVGKVAKGTFANRRTNAANVKEPNVGKAAAGAGKKADGNANPLDLTLEDVIQVAKGSGRKVRKTGLKAPVGGKGAKPVGAGSKGKGKSKDGKGAAVGGRAVRGKAGGKGARTFNVAWAASFAGRARKGVVGGARGWSKGCGGKGGCGDGYGPAWGKGAKGDGGYGGRAGGKGKRGGYADWEASWKGGGRKGGGGGKNAGKGESWRAPAWKKPLPAVEEDWGVPAWEKKQRLKDAWRAGRDEDEWGPKGVSKGGRDGIGRGLERPPREAPGWRGGSDDERGVKRTWRKAFNVVDSFDRDEDRMRSFGGARERERENVRARDVRDREDDREAREARDIREVRDVREMRERRGVREVDREPNRDRGIGGGRAEREREAAPPPRGAGGAYGSGGASKRARFDDEQPSSRGHSRQIKVKNIPNDLNWRDIQGAFEAEAGKIEHCEMSPKGGMAWIIFTSSRDAQKAVETFDRGELNGKTIEVSLV